MKNINDKNTKDLKSTNKNELIKTINSFRKSGKPEQLPTLIKILLSLKDEDIKEKIYALLNDVKDKNIRPFIIEAIKDDNNKSLQTTLIASCWQSGIDYSDYLIDFCNFVITADYETTIEIYTVIEEMNFTNNLINVNEAITILKHNFKDFDYNKKSLVSELIKFLENQKKTGNNPA